MRKLAAFVFIFILFLVISEAYLSVKGYNFDYLTEVQAHLDKTPPSLRTCVSRCAWGLERGLYQSSEDRKAWETVWPDGRRASASQAKSAQYNVLLLGCSYVFGSGLSDRQTLAWKLNEKYPYINFDNYGVPGWGTYQCLLLEKELLSQKKYDLVVYCAIEDHRNRNTEYKFVGSLRPGKRYALYPRVGFAQDMYCQAEHEAAAFLASLPKEASALQYYPSNSQLWPGQFSWRIIDFAKRVWVGKHTADMDKLYAERSHYFDHFMPAKEHIFWLLVQEMARTAQNSHTPFALAFLEGDPTLWRYSPIIKSRLNYAYWPLSWPALKQKQFRIAHLEGNHPNEEAQNIWLQKIGPYIESALRKKRQ